MCVTDPAHPQIRQDSSFDPDGHVSDLLYRLNDEQAFCSLEHPEEGSLRLKLMAVSAVGAHVDSTAEFPENEYMDVGLELDGQDGAALFAHVASSGADGLHLRWLHFDPSERERLAERIGTFASSHGLEGEPLPDEPDASKSARRRSRTFPAGGVKTAANKAEHPGTRRVTRPRATGTQAADESGEPPKRQTRKIARPRARTPNREREDDALTPFSDADARNPEPPAADDGRGGRHRTSSIMPFADQTPQEGTPTQGGDPPTRRKTRRIVRPKAPPPAATGAPGADRQEATPSGSGGLPIIDETGKHLVIEATDRFQRMPEGEAAPTQSPAGGSEGTGSITRRLNVVGDDGKLDVGATIRSRAKTVNATELAARHKKVRVLNMSTIKALIQDAVEEAAQRLSSSLDESERKRLLEEAEGEFQERIKLIQAEKLGLETQAKALEEQLQRAQGLLEDERNKAISADQFTVSDKGMEDMEKRFERMVNRAIQVNGVNDQMSQELQQMVSHLLDTERERIAEQAAEAQSQTIALLEKKVSRLASTLEQTESERDRHMRHAAALEKSGGGGALQNVYQAGMDTEDPDRERKLELLRNVFDQNKEIREQLAASGLKVEGRRRKPPPPPPRETSSADTDAAASTEAAPPPSEAEPAAPGSAAADATEPPADDTDAGSETMMDPDDMPWEPGMSVSSEPIPDGESAVKMMTGYKDIAPPPLERAGTSAADTAATTAGDDDDAEADDDPYGDMGDPDDQLWEPGMEISSEPIPEGESSVKPMTDYKQFEPPPLERSKK